MYCQYYRVVISSLQFISAITQVVVVQGGDLIKWDKASIGYYVGIDIADGSVSEINNVDLWEQCSYVCSCHSLGYSGTKFSDLLALQIEDARNRYNGETDHARGRRGHKFRARLLCADCFEVQPLIFQSHVISHYICHSLACGIGRQ